MSVSYDACRLILATMHVHCSTSSLTYTANSKIKILQTDTVNRSFNNVALSDFSYLPPPKKKK